MVEPTINMFKASRVRIYPMVKFHHWIYSLFVPEYLRIHCLYFLFLYRCYCHTYGYRMCVTGTVSTIVECHYLSFTSDPSFDEYTFMMAIQGLRKLDFKHQS